MGNGFAKTVLLEELDASIDELDSDEPNKDDPHCSTRKPVKNGLSTLLKIKRAEMKETHDAKNSIRIGNVTLSGTLTIVVAAVTYAILKIHHVI